MKCIADQLPPEIAQQIHPARRKNDAAYWAVRDQLLEQYRGQWIGFADGAVIASGSSSVAVLEAAEASGEHPFFICVGREDEPCRIRRLTFPYDYGYPGEALPVIRVEFRQASGSPGVVLDRVIPDTGADASVLPLADCQRLQLTPAQGVRANDAAPTMVYVYFVTAPNGKPNINNPLNWQGVDVIRVAAGGTFNVTTWAAGGNVRQYRIKPRMVSWPWRATMTTTSTK
jgi:hypothetical protein